jgi:hypothetical protein
MGCSPHTVKKYLKLFSPFRAVVTAAFTSESIQTLCDYIYKKEMWPFSILNRCS